MSQFRLLKHVLVQSRGGHCWKCGREDLRVLRFHHIKGRKRYDVRVELFKIAHDKPGAVSINVLKDEVQKCAILCKDCEAKVLAGVLVV